MLLYIHILLNQPEVRLLLLITLGAGLVAGAVAGSRRTRIARMGLVWSLGVVLSVTLFTVSDPGLGSGHWRCDVALSWATLTGLVSSEGLLNIALFVPLGFFLARLIGRSSSAAAVGVTVSVVIELVQATMGGQHACTLGDVVANSAGACLGAISAKAWRTARARSGHHDLLTARLHQ